MTLASDLMDASARKGPAATVERACPTCGADAPSRVFAPARVDEAQLDEYAFASRKVPEYMHHRLLECGRCDLVYASPAPKPEALADAYRDAAYDSAEEARFASRTYGAHLDSFAGRLPDRDGALDIGTGEGSFLSELLDRGFANVIGVEPSAAPIAAAPDAVRGLIREAVFEPGDFEPQSMSLVTCFQTIEHVPDPLEAAAGAHRLLKPGGALFIVCHNRRSWPVRALSRRSPVFDIEHVQLFSPQSARALLQQAGFNRIEVSRVSNRYPLRYWVRLSPLPAPAKSLALAATRSRAGDLALRVPTGNLAVVGFKD